MQNIDYSKQLKSDTKNNSFSIKQPKFPTFTQQKTSSIVNVMGQQGQPLSFLYLFVGAVLFFTSGLVIGMKIDQKETYFSSNENNSFKNISQETSDKSDPESKMSFQKTEIDETTHSTKSSPTSTTPIVPKDFDYPPQLNKMNYIIHVGNFSQEDVNKWGKYIIRQKQDLQGRLFKTPSGKLYLGYYQDKKQAGKALKEIQELNEEVFSEASIKKVQF